MLRRRLMMLAKPVEPFPAGYIRLDYVEATGKQWINTGATFTSTTNPTQIDIRFKFNDLSKMNVVFGRANSTNNYGLFYFGHGGSGTYLFGRFSSSGSAARFGVPDTGVHDFCFKYGEGVYIDGVLYPETVEQASSSYSPATTSTRVGLFTRNRGASEQGTPDTSAYMSGRIYHARFYKDGKLDYNFVPALKIATGEVGLLDLVRETFYPSATDVALLGGTTKTISFLPPEYTQLSYIENAGGSYIDTGYVCSSDTAPSKIRAVFQPTSPRGGGDLFGTVGSTSGFTNPLIFGQEWYGSYSKWFWVFLHDAAGKLNSTYARFGTPTTDKNEIVFVSKEGLYLNGERVPEADSHVALSSNSGYSLMIFGRNNAGQSVTRTNFKAKLFEFEISGAKGLERKYVPAQRKSDGEIGLYDLLTRTFLTTPAETKFVGG